MASSEDLKDDGISQAEAWHVKVMTAGRWDDMMGNTDTSECVGQSTHGDALGVWARVGKEALSHTTAGCVQGITSMESKWAISGKSKSAHPL